MSDSAAKITPLIASQERTAAASQPAFPAPSFKSNQALPASPINAATPTALSLDGSAGKHAPSLAVAHSVPATVDAAPLEKAVAGLQLRLHELQVENQALVAAATNGSSRSVDPSAVIADADARHLYSVAEALLASNRAMQDSLQAIQDRHQSSLQSLQESLISSQHSLQEALVQTQNFTLAFAAVCLGAALLAVVVVRGRVGPS